MEIIVEIPNEVFVDFSVSKVLFDALEQGILISQVAAAAVQGLGAGNAPAGPTPGSANSAKGSTASAGASNVSSGASSGANPQAAAISASKHATVSSGIGQMKLKLPDGKDVLMKEISEAAESFSFSFLSFFHISSEIFILFFFFPALLCFCLNLLNMFPNKSGAEVISTNFSEFPYLPEKQDVSYPSPKVHHFCVQEDKLITIMESPKNPQSLRIIVRDMTGRYCWEHKLSMNEKASLFKFLDEKRNQNSAKAEELNSSLDVVSNKQHADGNVNKKVSDKNEKPQSESTKDKNAASDDEEEDDEKSVAGLTPAQELEKDNETLTNNDNDDDEDELIGLFFFFLFIFYHFFHNSIKKKQQKKNQLIIQNIMQILTQTRQICWNSSKVLFLKSSQNVANTERESSKQLKIFKSIIHHISIKWTTNLDSNKQFLK